ncbi:HAD family hydrolase [Quadrisphaera sp. DSM 44207]|uniref:HAD family hydrolase n=1 Tax=Quadrisphaera sp. DSM 44207 TaxID=1881057 RepID=UPI000B815950|nr:HAD family hydrolase [Quadrisphaera sp. DSM 44207]
MSGEGGGGGGAPSPVRLVATDLDGTLVRRDGSVSARTVAALDACRRAGVDVVAVTGRPPRWLADLADVVGRATAICANGAIVYDIARRRVVEARVLAPDDVLAAVAAVRAAVPGTTAAVETLQGFRREPDYRPRHHAGDDRVAAPLPQLLADDPGVVKLLLRCEGVPSDRALALAEEALCGLAEPTHSGLGGLVEVSARGVSKAATLARLATQRGVDAAEVAAFGDMPNDLAMLAWAGHSYAVADGHPDVLAAASAVAPPCEEDGVAQVLERLVLARCR